MVRIMTNYLSVLLIFLELVSFHFPEPVLVFFCNLTVNRYQVGNDPQEYKEYPGQDEYGSQDQTG